MRSDPLEVDELLSWAARSGGEVRVQLRLPGAALAPGAAQVRLTGPRRFRVPAQVTAGSTAADSASVVAFSAAQAELGRAVWRLAIRPSSGSDRFVRVRARLLAPPGSPVALLPGPAPATRMPAPAPRPRPSTSRRLARRLPVPVRRVLLRARAVRRGAVRARRAQG